MPVSEVAGPEGTVVTLFVLEFLCLNGLGAGFGAFFHLASKSDGFSLFATSIGGQGQVADCSSMRAWFE